MKERKRHRIAGIRRCGIKRKDQVCDSFYTGCGSSMVLRTTTMGYDDSEIKK